MADEADKKSAEKAMKKDRETWPKDTVIIHQIGRGPWAPSLSPFPIKLETYCRMAKIPQVGMHKYPMSTKGKTPWITYNNDDVADSHFCIQYLNKKFNIDLNSHLTTEQKAIGRAFQTLVEDNLYWALAIDRWLFSTQEELCTLFGPALPLEIQKVYQENMRRQGQENGMGRHSKEEIRELGLADVEAISSFLGSKKFLFGDQVCEQDATVFAILSGLWYQTSPSAPYLPFIKEKCPNLIEYVERMKTTFWPDWDDYITHGHTKPSEK